LSGGDAGKPRRVVLVSGLSGAGKASILRILEDLGYEAVDNPPLRLIGELVARGERGLAIGTDTRSRGFRAEAVLQALARLRATPGLHVDLVFAWAEEAALLRRFSETRRRHPLAPYGRMSDGIAAEQGLTAPLRDAADLLVDTSELSLNGLRRLIEQHFAGDAPSESPGGLLVSLVSFAYPRGLPREADMVFDARFLRNPHYDPALRAHTGLDAAVGAYIEADADYAIYIDTIRTLLLRLLPRFVQEGKKYLTVAVGCTGGRHRSVHIIASLAAYLVEQGWRVSVSHRELASGETSPDGGFGPAAPPSAVQAQEA